MIKTVGRNMENSKIPVVGLKLQEGGAVMQRIQKGATFSS